MINVRYANMPYSIKALSTPNSDDTYTVILNSRLTFEQLQKSFLHELSHIFKGDFYENNINISEFNVNDLSAVDIPLELLNIM